MSAAFFMSYILYKEEERYNSVVIRWQTLKKCLFKALLIALAADEGSYFNVYTFIYTHFKLLFCIHYHGVSWCFTVIFKKFGGKFGGRFLAGTLYLFEHILQAGFEHMRVSIQGLSNI